jgi:hypothetical protein
MWHVWGRNDTYFWWKNLMERKHLTTLATGETITLDCVVKNEDVTLWAGVI